MKKIALNNFNNYYINKKGEIFSKKYNKLIKRKLQINHNGYKTVSLYNNDRKSQTFFVHRLVLFTFIGPADGKFASHLNGVRTDNRLKNLKWDTIKGNIQMKKLHGTHQCGEKHGGHKLKEFQVIEIRKRHIKINHNSTNSKLLAKEFNITKDYLNRIIARKCWKHI
jgi:hypothetical protein